MGLDNGSKDSAQKMGKNREGTGRKRREEEELERSSAWPFLTKFQIRYYWSVPLSQRSPENCGLQTHRKPLCCRLSSLHAPPLRQQLGQQGDFTGILPESMAPRSLVWRLHLLPPSIIAVSDAVNLKEMSQVERTTNVTNVTKLIFASLVDTEAEYDYVTNCVKNDNTRPFHQGCAKRLFLLLEQSVKSSTEWTDTESSYQLQ